MRNRKYKNYTILVGISSLFVGGLLLLPRDQQEQEPAVQIQRPAHYSVQEISKDFISADYQQLTGENVTVAILDSGVHAHADLTENLVTFVDFIGKQTSPYDDFGHGTEVAGIIGGTGKSSKGNYRGAAPDAQLIMVKCLDSNGEGDVLTVIRGINWVIEHKEQYNIKVLCLSLGFEGMSIDQSGLLHDAVRRAKSKDLLLIASSGNKSDAPVTSPGNFAEVLSVGSLALNWEEDQKQYVVADYTSRGLTSDQLQKPDLYTFGEKIMTASSDNGYTSVTGTSYAAAYVTGQAAQLYEKFPDSTSEEIADALKIMYETNRLLVINE